MSKNNFKQEAVVMCCETIVATAKQLGLEQYNLANERFGDRIAQLERINEVKAKLHNLEAALEDKKNYKKFTINFYLSLFYFLLQKDYKRLNKN